ncbi:Uncharacterised protein [Allocoprococcus comes]|mgnify:CR=1 FL=1|uniref:Uncharacterized protein n=1 Tax=Coprococcus comes TaxID=410072 RepID=A0A173TDY6_9FIRM|nr:Uncharacterised protein [Coprococcus comes]
MIRTLLKEVKEYKAASIATPFFYDSGSIV